MGADGGYCYLPETKIRKKVGDADFELFRSFICHGFNYDVAETSVDVEEWEAKNLKGKGPCLKIPEGTNIYPEIESDAVWDPDRYTNSRDEFDYFMQFRNRDERYFGDHYWWQNPRSWFRWEYPYYILPTAEELERLARVAEAIALFQGDDGPIYLETWT